MDETKNRLSVTNTTIKVKKLHLINILSFAIFDKYLDQRR